MGWILFLFSAVSFGYSLTLPTASDASLEIEEATAGLPSFEEEEGGLLSSDPKTFYLFATVLAAVGSLCIFFAKRRQSQLAK